MKVAVTACHGFLGGHLCDRLLDAGHQVVGLDDRDRPDWARIDAVRLDLGEPRSVAAAVRALSGCSAVFHLPPRLVSPDLGPLLSGTVLRTSHLLQAMRLCGVRRLVLSSTVSVYGQVDRSPIDEDAPLRPENPYQVAHAHVESLGEIFSRTGADVTVLRTTSVFGGRDRASSIHAWLHAASRGLPIRRPSAASIRRDHVHVADVVDAHLAALVRPADAPYRVYNVGSGEAPSERDLVEIVFDVLGRRSAIELGGDGRDHDRIADISRARASLGYAPCPLRDRIAEFAATLHKEPSS